MTPASSLRPRASRLGALGLVAASLLCGRPALADQPAFAPTDVQTVFFINKSDDHNRVDYGLRLLEGCQPVAKGNKAQAIVAYWREFEQAPPVRTHALGWYEHTAYGISDQKVLAPTASGVELAVKLRRLPREIVIETHRAEDGRCTAVARTTIAGVTGAELDSAFVQLSGPLSVAYVELRGRDPRTGAPLEERVKK